MQLLDMALLALLIACGAYLAFASPVPMLLDVFAPSSSAALVLVAVALAGGILLFRIARRTRRAAAATARAALVLLVALVAGMTVDRIALRVHDAAADEHWPPRREDVARMALDSLPPAERAKWGARIAAHVATLAPEAATVPDTLAVPREWPFPGDVEIAHRVAPDGDHEFWSRTADGTETCIAIDVHADDQATSRQWNRCEGAPAAPDAFAAPHRVETPPSVASAEPVGAPWPQYRLDAGHAARVPGGAATVRAWHTAVDGPIRASVSVVGDNVLVGTHATGMLGALDLATGELRWSVRVPNWIHQDPVSDGRLVVVGFGDNAGSFSNRAPSGVAAYDVATGHHLWTAFEESSVMTSPVIRDSVLVYGTGLGTVRKRLLATGALLAERALPGGVTMAPPASVGDTIVFTLDHDAVCVLRISSFEPLWCRHLPDVRMLGHAAPTIDGDLVIVSGAATILTPEFRELFDLPRDQLGRLVSAALFPGAHEAHAGQLLMALDLATGETRWQSELFANPRIAGGHLAGTAVVSGQIGAVVLPMSDTLVAFDRATGHVRWTAGGLRARGPVLAVGDRIIRMGRDGTIEARRLLDGALLCSERRSRGFDRAGPTLAGDMLIAGTLDGIVEAIPAERFLRCEAAAPPEDGS